MKMKRYLNYIYKNNKSLFKRDRGKALQEPIEHWFHKKNPLINSNADPKPTLKTLQGNIISKSLQYFFSSENWHSNYNIFR